MSDYRRFRVPGGHLLLDGEPMRHVHALREAVRLTRRERPFNINAWVVLSDHLHCVWTLPPGDDDFANRWRAIKIRFVQALPRTERRSKVRIAKGERGIWQRRLPEAEAAHPARCVHIPCRQRERKQRGGESNDEQLPDRFGSRPFWLWPG